MLIIDNSSEASLKQTDRPKTSVVLLVKYLSLRSAPAQPSSSLELYPDSFSSLSSSVSNEKEKESLGYFSIGPSVGRPSKHSLSPHSAPPNSIDKPGGESRSQQRSKVFRHHMKISAPPPDYYTHSSMPKAPALPKDYKSQVE